MHLRQIFPHHPAVWMLIPQVFAEFRDSKCKCPLRSSSAMIPTFLDTLLKLVVRVIIMPPLVLPDVSRCFTGSSPFPRSGRVKPPLMFSGVRSMDGFSSIYFIVVNPCCPIKNEDASKITGKNNNHLLTESDQRVQNKRKSSEKDDDGRFGSPVFSSLPPPVKYLI